MDKNKLNRYTRYFLKGKLSLEKERELLTWIKQSEENHSIFLKEQEEINQLPAKQKNIELTRSWKSVRHRMLPTRARLVKRKMYLRVASVAAAFVIGVLGTILFEKNIGFFDNHYRQLQNITVPFGAKTNIELPDGSLVWLNSGSTLTYPIEFAKDRPVSLNGEAFFEVEEGEKPFIVKTNYGEVEVKGTSFNVKAYANENLQTTLITGAVLVSDKEKTNKVTLEPGQQANVKENRIIVSSVETDLFTSWKEGKLILRKEYLPTAAKRLERWYNVKIELDKDKRLNEIWISGTLELETFSEVLELLKVTSPIDFAYNEDTRTIKIKYKQK